MGYFFFFLQFYNDFFAISITIFLSGIEFLSDGLLERLHSVDSVGMILTELYTTVDVSKVLV